VVKSQKGGMRCTQAGSAREVGREKSVTTSTLNGFGGVAKKNVKSLVKIHKTSSATGALQHVMGQHAV